MFLKGVPNESLLIITFYIFLNNLINEFLRQRLVENKINKLNLTIEKGSTKNFILLKDETRYVYDRLSSSPRTMYFIKVCLV